MSTILLAEDDPDILYMVSFKLRRAGFDVVETADGFAALELARQERPDLVLLDVRMPRMDGITVCRELRAAPHTERVPIIMLTARARPQDREQAYAAGATGYIVKPFSPRELVLRVEAALAHVSSS
jgi:two-component system, OmpR family, phosphate regulon response regulator PhoB